ncbi:smg-7 suppressor with morphological effect on genitalia protein 7 [Holotrichia oblita]|uniref:Smg-7 suppressor with morphological effect on genitalia protein 7 n=1 Tax=Holotrichia oblita TaxID=644536 RepID=A0ACB9T028_HOLOL|nr:smg-7 suppressor with morphological effect on genitalia protein 7 [Holotrichia oblita]
MGYKAAVQVLKQADVLKAKLCKSCDLLTDTEIWVNQQQLQTIYHQVLVLDLEYALDKKVEQELWTLGFKNQISTLQELAKDKKNPKRQDFQALLSWCLEAASGFYLTLLQELCTTFDLDLPFRRSGAIYGQFKSTYNNCEQVTTPQSSSCLYICQYCLVHLGDIARYRNQRQQAENFYKQAILVSPTSGQPYNQLALLEASQGNKLSTVFHYIRAIAVKNPFPVSSTNLSTTLTSAMDKDDPIIEIQTKMSVSKLVRLFLHIHGLLRTTTDLDQAEIGVKSINATLTALVATQSFTSDKLIKMVVINMYALWNITGNDIMKVEEVTKDERKACQLILDLIAGSLSAFLLPIYTLKNDETLLEYYALPAIKLICFWVEKSPEILNDAVFTNRLQIWPSFCKLLNNIQEHLKEFKCQAYETIPLAEDKELQGFLPLAEPFKSLNFKSDAIQTESPSEKHIRAKRLIDFGIWLTSYKVNNSNLIISKNDLNGVLVFEPGCIQPDPTDQLLELMKSVNVTEIIEPKKQKEEDRYLKTTRITRTIKGRTEQIQNVETLDLSTNGVVSKTDPTKMKRVKQNVALQSIFKKIEENKQVKFSEETTDKEAEKAKLRQQQQVQVQQQTQQQIQQVQQQPPPPLKPPITATPILPQQQYRTQTFNQNHPGLSTNIHQDFYSPSVQSLPKIGELPPAQNLYFQNSDLKNTLANTLSKIPQTMQYTVPPPAPQSVSMRMVPNMPTQTANQFNSMPFRAGPWTNAADDRKDNFQQPPQQTQQQTQHNQPPQHDNFLNMPFASNLFGQNRAPPMNVDYNQASQNAGVFNMWGNTPRGPQMGSFGSVNQNMSMRQAMLNEAKHMGPIGTASGTISNNMPKHPDNIQHTTTPGYSLFDTNWHPSLPIRQADNTTQRSVASPHHSLFSGPSHSSLKQLLEQQNQYQKNDK